eukprot:scaffold43082_cov31-Cyclotella_meneghiniana.AAC.3
MPRMSEAFFTVSLLVRSGFPVFHSIKVIPKMLRQVLLGGHRAAAQFLINLGRTTARPSSLRNLT